MDGIKGIDVSKHNGAIDFNKVKASGMDFVIIRAGYGRHISQKDTRFEEYYAKAKSAGLDVGAYWYSYASTVAEGITEAQTCVEAIKGKRFEYPIFFDLEEQKQFSQGRKFCSELVGNFCSYLEAAGYFAGLYISRSPLQTHITDRVAKRYALWVAEYNATCKYNGSYGMWQYAPNGRVSGISGDVDLDICYIDYPSIIKRAKLNGYKEKKYRIEIGDFDEVKAMEEFQALKKRYSYAVMKEVT